MILQILIGSIKMASKAQQKNLIRSELSKQTSKERLSYCDDCLYHWCKKRSTVTFCTMKSKGLFECKSCMSKIIGSFEKEFLYTGNRSLKKIEVISLRRGVGIRKIHIYRHHWLHTQGSCSAWMPIPLPGRSAATWPVRWGYALLPPSAPAHS